MHIQLTRKRIVNTLLIGTLALGIGSLTLQPAIAQLSRSTFREMARELNLSRSQTHEMASIMRSFNSELEEILTPEQFDLLQSVQEQRQSQSQLQPQSQPQTQDLEDLQGALNLTETQSAQLAVARETMVVELQEILAPYQLERIMEMTPFGGD